MQPLALVIFGITSNLSQRYLIPSLYDMEEKGILPEGLVVVGISRSPITKSELTSYITNTLSIENKHHKHPIQKKVLEKLNRRFYHLAGNTDDKELYPKLDDFLNDLKTKGFKTDNRIFYLATYPNLYPNIFQNLKNNQMNEENAGFVRVIIEKPIGINLKSAKGLNELLHKYFKEQQIFRLDHYLGKETLQNILTFRFGNSVFEPVFNKDYVDHIQITASEDYGIGDRGGYFDNFGMLKDVGQNHQLQMLAFVTMESPIEFSNDAITKERLKLLKSLVPEKIVFGQYSGYLQEKNVDKNSKADTFYALKASIKNSRFRDVPVYIRAGKKLEKSVTEISIVFKKPVNKLFKHLDIDSSPNVLTFRIYPEEEVTFKIWTKKPGQDYNLDPSFMIFKYPDTSDSHHSPDEHERLIINAIEGDPTFFNDAPEIEAQWEFTDPLSAQKKDLIIYKPGTWGPREADELIEKDGRKWIS